MAWSGKDTRCALTGHCTEPSQLCPTQAFGAKGGYQEDHPIRPFYVLPTNTARNEAPPLLQS